MDAAELRALLDRADALDAAVRALRDEIVRLRVLLIVRVADRLA